MPSTTSSEHAQPATTKTTNKKAGKAGRDSILDDAPLFAGLDDFCLNQSTVEKTELPRTVTERPKKKTVVSPAKQATPVQPPPPATKARKTAPEAAEVLLSVAEMCALLKISRATLIRLDKAGRIPGRIKLGGSVRFHRATVDAWLQSLISTHPVA